MPPRWAGDDAATGRGGPPFWVHSRAVLHAVCGARKLATGACTALPTRAPSDRPEAGQRRRSRPCPAADATRPRTRPGRARRRTARRSSRRTDGPPPTHGRRGRGEREAIEAIEATRLPAITPGPSYSRAPAGRRPLRSAVVMKPRIVAAASPHSRVVAAPLRSRFVAGGGARGSPRQRLTPSAPIKCRPECRLTSM